jgi:DNA-binding NtrC family response regulator
MPVFRPSRRALAQTIAELNYANPFLPERTDLERRALGGHFVDVGDHWAEDPRFQKHPNLTLILEQSKEVIDEVRQAFAKNSTASDDDLLLYENLVLFYLYHQYRFDLTQVIDDSVQGKKRRRISWYSRFEKEANELLHPQGRTLPTNYRPAHLFSFFFQIRRAFHHIFRHIIGASPAIVRLQAAVWESIFTHDLGRYTRVLFDRMSDLSTLVTGPSGTGKELVARAIGLSGYIPFDENSMSFQPFYGELFHAFALSALSPSLVESELFGYKKGAFTGALQDRQGWLEISHRLGTVFLDEIGEVEPAIQVKLLRTLESRTFQRLGDTEARPFEGKVICATNRDLADEMQQGRFRTDLYYRICSDRIVTPSLAEQLDGKPEELEHLVLFVARRVAGEEASKLAGEVVAWIEQNLGRNYSWPGNFRELEQCVRNILIRNEYRPQRASTADPSQDLATEIQEGNLTADEIVRRYCKIVYTRTGSYEAAARRLGLDRRTVKAKVTEA